MEKRVLTVLRSGGEYQPQHVQAMQRQIAQWAPDAKFQCLSDTDVPGVETIPLVHNWPGWWAKLELFRLLGGYLYTDLDNVILGPLDEFFVGKYTTQRRGWNALMYVPENFHAGLAAYRDFAEDPDRWKAEFFTADYGVPFGDAGFVNQYARGDAWEDLFPGKVTNIVELIPRNPFDRSAGLTVGTWPYRPPSPETRVVLCANKNRRPWKIRMFQHLYEEKR